MCALPGAVLQTHTSDLLPLRTTVPERLSVSDSDSDSDSVSDSGSGWAFTRNGFLSLSLSLLPELPEDSVSEDDMEVVVRAELADFLPFAILLVLVSFSLLLLELELSLRLLSLESLFVAVARLSSSLALDSLSSGEEIASSRDRIRDFPASFEIMIPSFGSGRVGLVLLPFAGDGAVTGFLLSLLKKSPLIFKSRPASSSSFSSSSLFPSSDSISARPTRPFALRLSVALAGLSPLAVDPRKREVNLPAKSVSDAIGAAGAILTLLLVLFLFMVEKVFSDTIVVVCVFEKKAVCFNAS